MTADFRESEPIRVSGPVRDDLLQPTDLALQRLQPPHLVGQKPAASLPPVEVGHLADPRLPTDRRTRRAFLALLQDERLSRASVNFDAFIRFRSSPSQESLAGNSGFERSSIQ